MTIETVQLEDSNAVLEANHHRSTTTVARWFTVGAIAYYLQANLAYWIVHGLHARNWIMQGLFFVNCLSLATLSWISADWVKYFAQNAFFAPLWRRMIAGCTVFLTGSIVIFVILFRILFPLLIGRACLNQFHFWSEWTTAGLIPHICLVLFDVSRARRRHTLRVQLEADLLATALDRAELSILEAQIEPHFLFNTLAHVKRQYRLDADSGSEMLATLIQYLDQATPALQRSDWTVGDELSLVRAYLEILERRFGARFEFSITASAECERERLPALTVATLVENAVRHGLAPKADGGIVEVSADMAGDILQIEVSDNGVGLRQTSGTGLGLATVRARLQSVCGWQAQLILKSRQPSGVLASILIPRGLHA